MAGVRIAGRVPHGGHLHDSTERVIAMAVVLPAPTIRRYTITPRLADAWAQCPLQSMTPTDNVGSQALAWGSAIHTLLKLDGRRHLAGQCLLEPEDLVLRGTPNPLWRQDESFM